jgi:oligoendopeptidase F
MTTFSTALAVAGQVTIFSGLMTGSVRAQDAPPQEIRLSRTLYFADSTAEATSRAALHARIDPLVRATATADSTSLLRQLEAVDQAFIALQRHSAYLKALTLEDTQDRGAASASAAVNADRGVLKAAMDARLRRASPTETAALGPYARLARELQTTAAGDLSPDAERYRATVLVPLESDIIDAYDRQIESLGTFRGVASPDLDTRRAALARRNAAFDAAAPVTASMLGTLIDLENRASVARGFRNAADRKYASLGLNDTLVDQTLAAVAAEAPAYRRYEQILAGHAEKRLGVTPVLSDEQNVGATPPVRLAFGQARQLILDALAPLGADYVRRFGLLLDPANGRLDLAGGAHRASTGTSIDAYDAPVALYYTGFNGSLTSVGTIAHEGGHAIHRELMNTTSLPVYQRTGPHDLFEGYAIFNELLLLDHAAKAGPTAANRQYALERFLATIATELFTSAEETSFEKTLYTSASGHALLDRDRIDEIYRASIAPYEYWPMTDVGTSRAWMRKSLLFDDPLYLVNYLYASLVAVALYDRAHVDPEFANKYQALLRRGFDADPRVLLATLGIQLDDPGLVKRAAELFKAKTDELLAVYGGGTGGR